MAKGKFRSWMPLYSKQAWGRFYGYYPFGYQYPGFPTTSGNAVYRRQPTIDGIKIVHEKYTRPWDPRKDSQLSWRIKYNDAVAAWNALSPAEKEVWKQMRYPVRISGYNRFFRNYMLTQPPPAVPDHLLAEDGSHILKEDSYKIKLE